MQLYLSKVGEDIQLDSQRKNTFRKTEFQFEKFEDDDSYDDRQLKDILATEMSISEDIHA